MTAAVPELQALQGLIERTEWHQDDPLQQCLRLYEWINRLPALIMETSLLPEPALRHVLSVAVDPSGNFHSTQALLAFSAAIHDVGKAATYRVRPDGSTQCPYHEVVGARLTPGICRRFDLSSSETKFVTSLVRFHGEPYEIAKAGVALSAEQQQALWRCFERANRGRAIPLLILAYGDLVTSHLGRNNPAKYRAILRFYGEWLEAELESMTDAA